jgi:hypothetical protein
MLPTSAAEAVPIQACKLLGITTLAPFCGLELFQTQTRSLFNTPVGSQHPGIQKITNTRTLEIFQRILHMLGLIPLFSPSLADEYSDGFHPFSFGLRVVLSKLCMFFVLPVKEACFTMSTPHPKM